MTIKEALIFGETKLNSLETPNLDAAVLLAFIIKKPKIFLYAHGEKNLTTSQWRSYQKLIKRRMRHEPVAYLVGEKEFYGRTFFVDKRVLIPRPETEFLIDTAKTIKASIVIDVGTGSGAIAVTLAKELAKPIIAIDISTKALAVAQHNAQRHNATVKFLRGNLLEPILSRLLNYNYNKEVGIPIEIGKSLYEALKLKAVLIVANLPYLPTNRAKMLSLDIKKYEPRLALMGGTDGLKYYRQLLQQIKKLPARTVLVAEIDSLQEKSFTQMAKKILLKADLTFKKDLAGYIRIAILKTN